jgi:glycine cleavage system H protein
VDPKHSHTLAYRRARFTTQLPLEYLYTPRHFWIGRHNEQAWRIGLTKFGSRLLGEMVDYGFEVGRGAQITPGQVIGWVEGFKAISELISLTTGTFSGANASLEVDFTLVNQDPYGEGWIYAIQGEPDQTCVDAQAYARMLDDAIDKLSQAG